MPEAVRHAIAMTDIRNGATLRVSAVIATLGGASLTSTIEHLNAGSLVPAEILVCIPREESHKVATLTYPNVRILATDCRGQVPQRVAGFKNVSSDLVMQLDDDIVVEENCVEALVRELNRHSPRCAVAPALRWSGSGQSVYKKPASPLLSNVFFWLVNGRAGYSPGIVTRGGVEIGVCFSGRNAGAAEAEWLPGGCVLHRKENLVLENYFPFKGKAFCEDLIHSFHLRKRDVRLIVSSEAGAYISEADAAQSSMRLFFGSLWADLRARRYYVELSSRSKLRMYLFFFARIMRRMVR